MKVNIPSGVSREDVRSSVRAGSLVAISAAIADPIEQAADTVVDYAADVSGPNDLLWQPVWEVEDDGSSFSVAPGFNANKTTTNANAILIQVRNPGRTYSDILCTVSQWDSGDFQNGQNVAGNFTLTPSVAMPRVRVEGRTSL